MKAGNKYGGDINIKKMQPLSIPDSKYVLDKPNVIGTKLAGDDTAPLLDVIRQKLNKPIVISKNLIDNIYMDYRDGKYDIATNNPELQFFIDTYINLELDVKLTRYKVMEIKTTNIELNGEQSQENLVYVRDIQSNVNSHFIENTSQNRSIMGNYAKILQIVSNYCHIIVKSDE